MQSETVSNGRASGSLFVIYYYFGENHGKENFKKLNIEMGAALLERRQNRKI